jgi:hypothetical protein
MILHAHRPAALFTQKTPAFYKQRPVSGTCFPVNILT